MTTHFSEHLNWGSLSFGDLLLRLGLATVLGLLVGVERERLERAAGMRTHAVVCVGAALITIVSIYGFPAPGGEQAVSLDPSRIAAQIVSGVGFIGAGVIFMRRDVVRGLTTAASVWAISGVGITAGAGLYIPAAVGAGFMLLIQRGLRPLERRFFRHQATQHDVEIVASHAPDAVARIRQLLMGSSIHLHAIDVDRGGDGKADTIHLNLRTEKTDEILSLVDLLQDTDGVRGVRWRHGAAQRRNQGSGTGGGGGRDPGEGDAAPGDDDGAS
ncbi:MAG TPA: MgtC/SapB family protein [Thermomicrobiales bacterium]|nr:MgtC/SapB family protein [Thermomicrobiales bacterium]